MKVLFTVQSEGRGHMTQSVAVHEILSRSGHELVGVVAGTNRSRQLPDFFSRAFPVPVNTLRSPGFVLRKSRSLDMGATLWQTLTQLPSYRESLKRLRALVDDTRPDLVINFFEPLTGLAQFLRPLPCPVLAVGHQYTVHHPSHPRLPGRRIDQLGMKLFVDLVGCRSWQLALALLPVGDVPGKRWTACPPLLRRQLFALTPQTGDYLLIYLVNHGYSEEIRAWHRAHPDVAVHCFYDRPGAPETEQATPNLTFHRLDGEKFLRMMAGCRAVASTAGFESVSEGAWLGKPLLMVPVEHHVEQMTNAVDAARLAFGITNTFFDLDRLWELRSAAPIGRFREWVGRADEILERAMHQAVASGNGAPLPAQADLEASAC
jgi:uncharacterized protein (TIGR00661 family)